MAAYWIKRRNHEECLASQMVRGKRIVARADPRLRGRDAERDAENKLADKIRELAPNGTNTTLGDWVALYLDDKENRGEIRHSSRLVYEATYRSHIRDYPIAKKLVANVTADDCETYLEQMAADGRTTFSQKSAYKLVKAALQRSIKRKMRNTNPLVAVDSPSHRVQKRKKLDFQTIAKLLTALRGHRHEALFWIAANCAYRMCEIMGLRWMKFDYLEGTLLVDEQLVWPEGGGWALGPLKTDDSDCTFTQHPYVIDLLRSAKIGHAPGEFIFQNSQGGPLQPSNFRRDVWYPLLESAGLPRIAFHRFRNTSIATMYEAHDIGTARDLARHLKDQQTSDYIGREKVLPAATTDSAYALFDRKLARGMAAIEESER